MAPMPPLYRCIICGLPIRKQDNVAERKAIVWLKASGSSISEVVEELHDYKHSFCKERTGDSDGMTPPLF